MKIQRVLIELISFLLFVSAQNDKESYQTMNNSSTKYIISETLSRFNITETSSSQYFKVTLSYLSLIADIEYEEAVQIQEHFVKMVKETNGESVHQEKLSMTINNGKQCSQNAYKFYSNILQTLQQVTKDSNLTENELSIYTTKTEEAKQRLERVKSIIIFWSSLKNDQQSIEQALPNARKYLEEATLAEQQALQSVLKLETALKKLNGSNKDSYENTLWIAFNALDDAHTAVNMCLQAQHAINILKSAYETLSIDKEGIDRTEFDQNFVNNLMRISNAHVENIQNIICKINQERIFFEKNNEKSSFKSQKEQRIKQLETQVEQLEIQLAEETEHNISLKQQLIESQESFNLLVNEFKKLYSTQQQIMSKILPKINTSMPQIDDTDFMIQKVKSLFTPQDKSTQYDPFSSIGQMTQFFVNKISYCSIDDNRVAYEQTKKIVEQQQNQEEITQEIINEINDAVSLIQTTLKQISFVNGKEQFLSIKENVLNYVIKNKDTFEKIQKLLNILSHEERGTIIQNYPKYEKEAFGSEFKQQLSQLLSELLENKQSLQFNNQRSCLFHIFSNQLWNDYKKTISK